jgi:hypothetical protein
MGGLLKSLKDSGADKIIFGLVAGMVLGWFTHVLVIRRDSANRKRHFRNIIRKQMQELEIFDTGEATQGKL